MCERIEAGPAEGACRQSHSRQQLSLTTEPVAGDLFAPIAQNTIRQDISDEAILPQQAQSTLEEQFLHATTARRIGETAVLAKRAWSPDRTWRCRLGLESTTLCIGEQIATAAERWIADNNIGVPIKQEVPGIQQSVSRFDPGPAIVLNAYQSGIDFQAQGGVRTRPSTKAALVE